MYAQMIREELARIGRIGLNPALVEAWMRLEHSTLDGLTPGGFRDEVRMAADCVEAAPVESARLAWSYGLRASL